MLADENVAIEKKIGERIGWLRSQNNHETQEELAAAMGVSREIIQHWESATRKIKAAQIAKLAQHFNTTADYILGVRDYGTYDTSIAVTCETTGLSQKAVERLQRFRPEQAAALSSIIESESLTVLLYDLLVIKERKEAAEKFLDGNGTKKENYAETAEALWERIELAEYRFTKDAKEMMQEYADCRGINEMLREIAFE